LGIARGKKTKQRGLFVRKALVGGEWELRIPQAKVNENCKFTVEISPPEKGVGRELKSKSLNTLYPATQFFLYKDAVQGEGEGGV